MPHLNLTPYVAPSSTSLLENAVVECAPASNALFDPVFVTERVAGVCAALVSPPVKSSTGFLIVGGGFDAGTSRPITTAGPDDPPALCVTIADMFPPTVPEVVSPTDTSIRTLSHCITTGFDSTGENSTLSAAGLCPNRHPTISITLPTAFLAIL
jgi:hypothetical protein